MADFIRFDPSQTDFLRNFNTIAENQLSNLRDIQQFNFERGSNDIANQLNKFGITPNSGVFGAALGEYQGQHSLQTANMLRDLTNSFLGQRGQELDRMFGRTDADRNFAETQRQFNVSDLFRNNQLAQDQGQFNSTLQFNQNKYAQDFAENQRQFDLNRDDLLRAEKRKSKDAMWSSLGSLAGSLGSAAIGKFF